MIDSNNKLNSLSKNLIDEVRKIMEAKELSDKQKKIARLGGHPEKLDAEDFKKLRKEDAEMDKAKKDEDEKDEDEDEDEDEDKESKSKKKSKEDDEDKKDMKESFQRRGLSIAGAVLNKMRNEEAENLDELSRATVGRYSMKAKSIADNEGGKDRSKGRELAGRKKWGGSMKGVEPARVPATEEVELDEALDAAARYGQHHVAVKALLKSIGEHIEHHKKDALAHRDYRGKKGVHWGHVGDLAHIHSQLADVHDRLAEQGEYKKAMSESLDEDLTLEDVEQIDELSTDTLRKYREKARIDAFDAHDVDDDRRLRKRSFGHNQAGKKIIKRGDTLRAEEAELDESPVDGVAPGSMANDGHLCATKVFHKEWAEGTPIYSQHAEPDEDGNIAWYDVMFDHGIEKHVMTEDLDILMSETHERHGKKKMKEEAELEEARGRPRKNPLPTGQSDEPEPRQHIIQQLQRAKLSMQGGAKVKFKNGEEHHVHGQHAVKLLDKYAGMKPHEKESFQKKIGASHEGLKSEL